jgi:thiol-disulfide isomerase/thioredoxin
MRRLGSGVIVGVLVLLAVQTGCAPPTTTPTPAPSPIGLSVGQEAPEIVSHDLDGKEVRLSSLRGKVVVLDFWATWCGWCVKMIPHEKAMVERFKDKPFVLVGVSVDDSPGDVTAFLTSQKMPWTHWWDGPKGAARDWKIQGFPTTYLLDAKGIIRGEVEGYDEPAFNELEKTVNDLLKEMDEKKP